MALKVLVTGGMGFIGSHLVDELVRMGFQVTSYDSLEYQVHQGKWPTYVNKGCCYIVGNICDREKLSQVVCNSHVIFHEASVVGVGQSMNDIARYVRNNVYGTSVLLDILANEKHSVRKLVVASSMSIYGDGGLKDETAVTNPASIYAQTKLYQEQMCLLTGKTYNIPTVALRYFNVYGERQSLNNPYTGVCAIFLNRVLDGLSPIIYEDGFQTRDFVNVRDIVQANILAMDALDDYESYNVASGKTVTILEVAHAIIKACEADVTPYITNKYRVGDVRHCYADITKIKKFGYEPTIDFATGMKKLIAEEITKERV